MAILGGKGGLGVDLGRGPPSILGGIHGDFGWEGSKISIFGFIKYRR